MNGGHIWPFSLTDEEAVIHSKKLAPPPVDESGDPALLLNTSIHRIPVHRSNTLLKLLHTCVYSATLSMRLMVVDCSEY